MIKFIFPLLVLLAVDFLALEDLSLLLPVARAASIDGGETDQLLAQRQGRRRRKKGQRKRGRKKKPPGEATGSSESTENEGGAAAATGGATSIHGAQEGKDEPYSYEVALLSDFSLTNRTTGDVKGGTADYSLFLRGLYIISASIEAGVDFDFSESSSKSDDETFTSRSYGIAAVGVYNIGNLDEDTSLPYVYGSLGFRGGSRPGADGDISSSGFRFGLGGGYRYFVDSNVAIDGELGIEYGTESETDADDPTTVFKINILKVGFSLFI